MVKATTVAIKETTLIMGEDEALALMMHLVYSTPNLHVSPIQLGHLVDINNALKQAGVKA